MELLIIRVSRIFEVVLFKLNGVSVYLYESTGTSIASHKGTNLNQLI